MGILDCNLSVDIYDIYINKIKQYIKRTDAYDIIKLIYTSTFDFDKHVKFKLPRTDIKYFEYYHLCYKIKDKIIYTKFINMRTYNSLSGWFILPFISVDENFKRCGCLSLSQFLAI